MLSGRFLRFGSILRIPPPCGMPFLVPHSSRSIREGRMAVKSTEQDFAYFFEVVPTHAHPHQPGPGIILLVLWLLDFRFHAGRCLGQPNDPVRQQAIGRPAHRLLFVKGLMQGHFPIGIPETSQFPAVVAICQQGLKRAEIFWLLVLQGIDQILRNEQAAGFRHPVEQVLLAV